MPAATGSSATGQAALHRRRVFQAFAMMIAALLTLAVFRSDKLVSAVYDLPPSALNDRLIAAAEAWNSAMEAIGAAQVTQTVVDAIASVRDSEEQF